jgi:hypothetical protein
MATDIQRPKGSEAILTAQGFTVSPLYISVVNRRATALKRFSQTFVKAIDSPNSPYFRLQHKVDYFVRPVSSEKAAI